MGQSCISESFWGQQDEEVEEEVEGNRSEVSDYNSANKKCNESDMKSKKQQKNKVESKDDEESKDSERKMKETKW